MLPCSYVKLAFFVTMASLTRQESGHEWQQTLIWSDAEVDALVAMQHFPCFVVFNWLDKLFRQAMHFGLVSTALVPYPRSASTAVTQPLVLTDGARKQFELWKSTKRYD